MKTIQAIKATKNIELGQLRRVNEKDAESEVKNGYWKYVPKSAWKDETRQPKTEVQPIKKSKNEKNN